MRLDFSGNVWYPVLDPDPQRSAPHMIRSKCSGIEVVITGLTRNQFAGNRTWVRIPPAAPKSRNNLDIVGCKSTVTRCCGFFIFKISEVQKKMPNRNFLNRMDLNSGFRLFETQGSSGRPFSSQKGRLRTEKLYTKNRAPVCWYQRINRPGFFVFRRK